jgi:hypothetical protein
MVLLIMMAKTASSFVLGSSNPSTYARPTGGKILIRSHVIEASGSSEAWYVPPRGPHLLAALLTGPFDHPTRGKMPKHKNIVSIFVSALLLILSLNAYAIVGDEATHESDHQEDVLELPEVHVHGMPLNKDQQLGPVPKSTPWPAIPPALDGNVIDDWMKARLLVSKEAKVTVVILEPCRHRELTAAGIAALGRWTFDPQMHGDIPIDGELTVRIHFHTK